MKIKINEMQYHIIELPSEINLMECEAIAYNLQRIVKVFSKELNVEAEQEYGKILNEPKTPKIVEDSVILEKKHNQKKGKQGGKGVRRLTFRKFKRSKSDIKLAEELFVQGTLEADRQLREIMGWSVKTNVAQYFIKYPNYELLAKQRKSNRIKIMDEMVKADVIKEKILKPYQKTSKKKPYQKISTHAKWDESKIREVCELYAKGTPEADKKIYEISGWVSKLAVSLHGLCDRYGLKYGVDYKTIKVERDKNQQMSIQRFLLTQQEPIQVESTQQEPIQVESTQQEPNQELNSQEDNNDGTRTETKEETQTTGFESSGGGGIPW